MPRFTSSVDGAQLFYRDYKPLDTDESKDQCKTSAQPALVFIHGWPYSSLMYENIAVPLCQCHNFRCIAPDRRGFGKSDWDSPQSNGKISYTVFAQDTAHLLENVLNVGPFVVIASSMGPGESILAFEESEYFRQNCKGFIWISPSLPGTLPGLDNHSTGPQAVWDSILESLATHRAEYVSSALPGTLGGKTALPLSPGILGQYERIVEDADALAIQLCAHIIRSVDFTGKLRRLGENTAVPVLCIHGDSDNGTPYESSTRVVQDIVPRVKVRLYEQGAHGLQITHRERLIEDILGFIRNEVISPL
ncbi:alpha/beta fold hydrolase [Aspergillus tanneri]|uniref:AB hydrolase-1 domain-containing protein n=1 Tax=Aspergillus tanneri TaxID=1220188 RepID=A0A5M9MXW7_9EURO|nr:uncharacterized protein ATNIH1004_003495 [Aspergillus tanneri]KAA8650806.1 hypothetical protein ATNIH1004_003495 [Aspergillus tanneri]